MCLRFLVLTSVLCGVLGLLSPAAPLRGQTVNADRSVKATVPAGSTASHFARQVQPLIEKYCVRCHNADKMKSGIRLDRLPAMLEEEHLFLWDEVLEQVAGATMPPEDEPQPTAAERESLADCIRQAREAARMRGAQKNGSVRRLTVSQYRNTLRDLLGLEDDLTEILPPDATSKEGFTNSAQTLELSPLQLEAYFDIADAVLDLCIFDEDKRPSIQNFRVDLGSGINSTPCPDELILGANSLLLDNADFLVTELTPTKPFAYRPFSMRTAYEFIEGYEGNATVRGWRKFDSIYHAVFACMRGTGGYPKGEPYRVIPEGLLLRPAVPSSEIFRESSTYGPMSNFKISLRELPDRGNFRVTVNAARYNDGLLLDAGVETREHSGSLSVTDSELSASPPAAVVLEGEGIYQIDVQFEPSEKQDVLTLELGERSFSGRLWPPKKATAAAQSPAGAPSCTAFLLARLPAGPLTVAARCGPGTRLQHILLTRLDHHCDGVPSFEAFEGRTPLLGVYVGLRRDCGSTLARVGEPRPVPSRELSSFVFEGAIRDFPSPGGARENVNYLQGIREIGVRSEYTDGRDLPRLLIRSVEFEGPYYKRWPPATHRRIFIDSPHRQDAAAYAREVIRSFATRAFRRPITATEESSLVAVWDASFAASGDFAASVKDALTVVLTSPQFLFLIETSNTPDPETLDSYELASKLSYFLWNASPDRQLLDLAAADILHESLDAQVDRMIRDPRFGQFLNEFGSQWLSLDKFDVVEVDQQRFPKLTRDTKAHLREEPIQFLRYLIEQNLPLASLVHSDFIMANDVVADYYKLAERPQSGFRFVRVDHHDDNLGGILTQASILAGLSDGRESNPVKRGAWLARKIIAEPPDDPPPNVPALEESDNSELTLRESLARHRNQEGCAKCHAGIDPWGLPFEQFDAGGLLRQVPGIDTRATLPDGAAIADVNGLKEYLTTDRIDQVAFSFLKHLACYAVGRSLAYNELALLRQEAIELKRDDYRLQHLIRFVVRSDLFLKK